MSTSKGITIYRAMSQGAWLDELPPDLKKSALSIYGLRSILKIRRAILPHAVQVAAVVATRASMAFNAITFSPSHRASASAMGISG